MTKITILGAGINGLTCGVQIKEKYPNFDVVIISEEFTPNTTSDGCGGFWYPYLCGETPEHLLCKWGGDTYKFLHEMWLHGGYDICMLPVYELFREKTDLPIHRWAFSVFGYRSLNKQQLDYFGSHNSAKYAAGVTFTSFIVYPPSMLAYMTRRFKNANGKILHYRVSSLKDRILNDYDVVINCLGLGAKFIVPDDKVVPIRGQISKVVAPWVNFIVFDSGNYILPNVHDCVLGGTHQTNDFNRNLNSEDTDFIMNGCKNLLPGLKHAPLKSQWVGLRPAREQVRLEPEEKDGKLFIHNYGHGGSGLTLFWGCASNVLEIFDKYVETNRQKEKSKL